MMHPSGHQMGALLSPSLTVASGLDGRLGRGAGVEAEVLGLEAGTVQRRF